MTDKDAPEIISSTGNIETGERRIVSRFAVPGGWIYEIDCFDKRWGWSSTAAFVPKPLVEKLKREPKEK